jgi:uncharacterized protein YndB with AHSA1/START domain
MRFHILSSSSRKTRSLEAGEEGKMIISDKKIVKTRLVDKPIDDVWRRWTTHEGLKTFFGTDNKIELRPGGCFEIYFLMDNPIGLRGSEGCEVLSYLPEKMLSFSWNVPPEFEDLRKSGYKTWVVLLFSSTKDQNTEITLTHMGWPAEGGWEPVFDYFDKAWDTVLGRLCNRG